MDEKIQKPFMFPVMKKSIQELFKSGSITKEVIESFQEKYWEQMVPNFSQALKLLDIHDVSRHSILWNINDRLLEAVKSRIQVKSTENNSDRKQQKLWQKLIRTGMPYIHHPYIRSAIMMVLGQMTSIKSKHVSLIVDNDYLYKDAPLPVLRHIWITNESKFNDELMQVLQSYQHSMSDALLDPLLASVTSSNADTLPILYWPPRRRRRDPSLIRLVEMIGENELLYEKALEFLREEYAKLRQIIKKTTQRKILSVDESSTRKWNDLSTSKPKMSTQKREDLSRQMFISPALLPTSQAVAASLLCTIRFDVLMSFNEAKLDRICVKDPIHRFVWCMDACIKNKKIDRRHASELVTHLVRLRKNQPIKYPSSELGVDQDTSDDWEPESEEKGSSRKRPIDSKPSRTPHRGKKRTFSSSHPDDSFDETKRDSSITNFETDLKMVCCDPWVIYTICSTLLRLIILGLHEEKLPRNIPEVPFFVHLLMLGLENYLIPPEVDPGKSETKGKSARRRPTGHPPQPPPSPKSTPATVLITEVLPAVARLHLATWRSQVCDEIRNSSNRIWPKPSGADSHAPLNPSPSWCRRLESVVATPVSISTAYLAHPVGHLFLQYHALFALERRELTVLRLLLKAAANAAQVRTKKSAHVSKSVVSPQPISPQPQLTFGFRWRPECLQALSLGIASLPVSSDESGTNESAVSVAVESNVSEKVSTGTADTQSPPVTALLVGSCPSTVVTRAELASLLRASLPLQTDLQLLVLAQSAKLVSGIASAGTPGTPGTATPMPNFFPHSDVVAPRCASEKERLINTLSRHVDYPPHEGADDEHSKMLPPQSASFKTTNGKVVEALETLRREFDRTSSSNAIAMTPKPSSSGITSVPLSGPLNPFPGESGLQQCSRGSFTSPNRLMRPPVYYGGFRNPGRSATRVNQFPVATPLTNPGLSVPPPASSGLLPSSPLADYRPPSPGSVGGGYPTYATPVNMDLREGSGLSRYSTSLSPTGDTLKRYGTPLSTSTKPTSPPPSPP